MNQIKFGSVCSGIEAASVAWHPLGWKTAWLSEIEKFPSQVLAHHYPNTPNFGDMTKFKEWSIDATINVLVGGTPCQSFSVAGLRKGLDDPRGNLMLTYLAIAAKYRPQWLVWENVPGVLSSNGGLDFASLLRGMGECGYGFAYRILDAQYFGVAQRRRRVFVVGYLGNWRPAAAVLFERHSLCGYPAPSREKRQATTRGVEFGPSGGRFTDVNPTLDSRAKDGPIRNQLAGCVATVQTLRAKRPGEGGMSHDHEHIVPVLSPALNTQSGANHAPDTKAYVVQPIALAENIIGRKPENGGNGDGVTENGLMYTLNATGVHGVMQPIAFSGKMSYPQTDVDMTQTLGATNPMAVAHPVGIFQDSEYGIAEYDTAGTLRAGRIPAHQMALQAMAVRRLTPVECERLQGFGDNYTDIQTKGKATPDGPRYKALGNSMAVPVMAWIGKRIQEVEDIPDIRESP